MQRLAFLLALSACGLSGDPEEDLASLQDMRDVDCSSEPRCGAQIHCMTDALDDGAIGELDTGYQTAPSSPDWFYEYYFTYDGEIVKITESQANGSYGSMWEERCKKIEAAPTSSGCWTWKFSECSE